jgi:hypothetical protein
MPVIGERPSDLQAAVVAAAMDTVDESDPAVTRDLYRAKHGLAVSVMERPQQYVVAYSLGDIHRLTFLSHEERTAVRDEWHAWHRKYVRLGVIGCACWLAGAAAAWMLWFEADTLTSVIQSGVGLTIPTGWLRLPAVAATLGLLMALPALFATTAAPALANSYVHGYADGLVRGINRALHITPEIEQQMWEEFRRAERLDAGWRRVTEAPATD